MATLKFADTHNMVAFLTKPAESEGFEQIMDFLNANPIRYALTINPTIYTSCIKQFWATVKVKTVNGEVQLQALVDGKKIIITESTVRRDLQLEDAEGVDCLTKIQSFLNNYTDGKQKPRKPKRKDTQIPQSSGPTEHVADEAVYKELDDSLVRAATTASSLDAEQDMGNINKTQSKATPNEAGITRTTSVVPRGNTLQSGEDSLKLNELMELCINLQQRVLDLETTKTTQANKIASLKRRVKKIERRNKSRTHGLKRMYRVGSSRRVESYEDEGLGEVDASKQGRIADIDVNKDIYLVNVHIDEDMFGVNDLDGDEVIVDNVDVVKTAEETRSVVEEVTAVIEKAKLVSAAEEKQAKVEADYQLAQRLQAQEQEELTDEEKVRLFVQFLEQRRKHFAAKRAEEKRNRPPTRAQQRNIMSMKRVNTFVDYKTELVEESSKKAETELEENLMKAEAEVMEGSSKRAGEELEQENKEEIAINVVPLATKPPSIVDWKIHKEGKKSYYQIIRVDGKSQMYRVFSQMLKSFSREDLEDLYKIVKAKYGSTRPVEDLDLILYGDLKIMFKPHVEDQVWKNQDDYNVLDWKLYDSCGVHSLRMQHVYIYILVEKRYPLTQSTITDMLNKKLQDDYLNEMAYQLFKLLTKQLKKQ
ncbi:hypothetical protein Tco_1310988 [Tanacetum coccineum]